MLLVERRRTCSPGSSDVVVARRFITVVQVVRKNIAGCTRAQVVRNKLREGVVGGYEFQLFITVSHVIVSRHLHTREALCLICRSTT